MSENIKKCKNYEEYKDKVINLREEIEDCLNYDFSNDGASENYIELYDPIEKYYIYRIASKQDLNIKDYVIDENGLMKKGKEYIAKIRKEGYKCDDPDSNSKILQKIYSLLWNEENLKECVSKGNIQGDTMNSVGTTMMQLFECGLIETNDQTTERKKIKLKENSNLQEPSNLYQISRYANEEDKKIMIDKFEKIANLKKFLSLYHTLGNFIPFPVDCNGPRGTGSTKDYWDLTLKIIYDYYKIYKTSDKNINEEEISKISGRPQIKAFVEWLNSFEKWDNFVEKNYMQDFVEQNYVQDDSGEEKYGKPLELWKGHFEGKKLPENIGEFEEFYSNTSKLIKIRSARMLLELCKRSKNK